MYETLSVVCGPLYCLLTYYGSISADLQLAKSAFQSAAVHAATMCTPVVKISADTRERWRTYNVRITCL